MGILYSVQRGMFWLGKRHLTFRISKISEILKILNNTILIEFIIGKTHGLILSSDEDTQLTCLKFDKYLKDYGDCAVNDYNKNGYILHLIT